MFQQPATIQFSLPGWLAAFVRDYDCISDTEQQMAFVVEASRRNVAANTGGPFAAAIFEIDSGKLISLGVNLVTSQGLSMLHAEMVAIAVAQQKLGSYDLGGEGMAGHMLVSSTEPCAMCFGAIPWSGVRRVVTGARDMDARSIGFDEGPKPDDWQGALNARQIDVLIDVQRDAARQVLQDYLQDGGPIYNSRKSG